MQRLVDEHLLNASGKTNARRYELAPISNTSFTIKIDPELLESDVWRNYILSNISGAKQNVIDICQYGFTEMLNNVIDHSESKTAEISYDQTYATIRMLIIDHGVGIFNKIQKYFKLSEAREALLELSKGKLTSDAKRHSGEGIFFTSRMFNRFTIMSGTLCYSKRRADGAEWLIETETMFESIEGTAVSMEIATDATWSVQEIFDRFQDDDYLFSKTHVPISLAKYGSEQLVSRSQAKRVLARFEKFSEVILDFSNINEIGRAFADEIFRVFQNQHPHIALFAINASPSIEGIIAQVRAQAAR
jgi:anti-sigma regulatory factor (Ser/Thr protein kinase)